MRLGFPFSFKRLPRLAGFGILLIARLPSLFGANVAAASQELSLRVSIERALAKNFDLRIERQGPIAAGGQLDSAEAAYVPDLGLSATTSGDESALTGTDSRSSALTVGVSGLTSTGATYRIATDLASYRQSPLGGASTSYKTGDLGVLELTQPLLKNRAVDSSRLAIAQNRLALDSSRAALAQRAMEVVYSVESAYYALAAARQTVLVQESALEVARQTLADADNRLQIGTIAPLDAQSARAEAAAREADLISARQQVRQKQNALLAILTDDYAASRDAEIITTDSLGEAPVALDYAASVAHALARRPELDQLDRTLESSRLGTRYEQNQRLPQLDLTGAVGLNGAGASFGDVGDDLGDADHPSYSVGVTLTIPWSDRKSRGLITASRASERQAELGLAKQKQAILAEVDDAITAAEAALQKISATRAAREYADAALEAGRQRLAAGQGTAYQVLLLQRDLTSAQGAEIDALASYNTALAALRLRDATILDHWKIEPATVAAN